MSEDALAERQRGAARYLRELLLKPGAYRDAWQAHVGRQPRERVINQLAVAEVISAQLKRSAPMGGESRALAPYQLREVVSAALSGAELSKPTLELFVDSFGFSADDAGRLWRLWNGSSRITVLSGSHAVPMRAEQDLVAALGPRRHQALTMHDHVYVGADGRIDRARMIQVLEAIVPGVDRVPFICDTNVLTIEVAQGGKELSDEVRQISAEMFTTDILLARTLDLGETITLEYWLTYRFPGDLENPAEHEFRRGIMRRVENFNMRVEFDGSRLPAKVWWTHWDGLEGEVLEQEDVPLDSQHSAHRHVRYLERTAVGFRWEW